VLVRADAGSSELELELSCSLASRLLSLVLLVGRVSAKSGLWYVAAEKWSSLERAGQRAVQFMFSSITETCSLSLALYSTVAVDQVAYLPHCYSYARSVGRWELLRRQVASPK
jgi:hypothetical protein